MQQSQENVLFGIEGRVQNIQKDTKALPASPKTANAIDQGSDEVTTAAAKAIQSNSDNSSLSMFLPRG